MSKLKSTAPPLAVAVGARDYGGGLPHGALLPPAQPRPAAAGPVICVYSWTALVKMS